MTPSSPRKHGTCTPVDPKTGKVMRTGRTNDLERRAAEHRRDPKLKDYKFVVDKHTDDYRRQRGREQIIHDRYRPPLNKKRPIRPGHPNTQEYLDEAKKLGP